MVYNPPLVRPPLSPLRPPSPSPFRPPGPNRLPPTQVAPIFSPPTLLPPTDRDLKGTVCIYANAPIWESKKIRYKYPGESWQEIAGDRFTSDQFFVTFPGVVYRAWIATWSPPLGRPGNPFPHDGILGTIIGLADVSGNLAIVHNGGKTTTFLGGYTWEQATGGFRGDPVITSLEILSGVAPLTNCLFKVFNIFSQEILSITKDVCPEVMIVPEKCYYQAENERLVRKVIVGFFQNLRIEYNQNCATVLLDSPPLPFATEIYKECSDNPSCPPPRIRFDKKCEQKCEQCPPGTAIKVLLGNNIACVDSVGCVLKIVKYKPGCNNYDCICI